MNDSLRKHERGESKAFMGSTSFYKPIAQLLFLLSITAMLTICACASSSSVGNDKPTSPSAQTAKESPQPEGSLGTSAPPNANISPASPSANSVPDAVSPELEADPADRNAVRKEKAEKFALARFTNQKIVDGTYAHDGSFEAIREAFVSPDSELREWSTDEDLRLDNTFPSGEEAQPSRKAPRLPTYRATPITCRWNTAPSQAPIHSR